MKIWLILTFILIFISLSTTLQELPILISPHLNDIIYIIIREVLKLESSPKFNQFFVLEMRTFWHQNELIQPFVIELYWKSWVHTHTQIYILKSHACKNFRYSSTRIGKKKLSEFKFSQKKQILTYKSSMKLNIFNNILHMPFKFFNLIF